MFKQNGRYILTAENFLSNKYWIVDEHDFKRSRYSHGSHATYFAPTLCNLRCITLPSITESLPKPSQARVFMKPLVLSCRTLPGFMPQGCHISFTAATLGRARLQPTRCLVACLTIPSIPDKYYLYPPTPPRGRAPEKQGYCEFGRFPVSQLTVSLSPITSLS